MSYKDGIPIEIGAINGRTLFNDGSPPIVLELFGTSSAVVHRFLLLSTLHVSAETQDEDHHDDEDDQESKQGIVGVNQEITGFTRRKPLCYIIGAI
jgi:hypothetical protein